jgi:hypothetical protein
MKTINAADTGSGAAKTAAKNTLTAMAAEFTKDAATAKGADANRLKALGAVILAVK